MQLRPHDTRTPGDAPVPLNTTTADRGCSVPLLCQSQPCSVATSSTVRPIFLTWTVTHRAARDVNNARTAPIAGSCSMNDPTQHSGFGHVQRRFSHRSRTGRPNASSTLQHNRPIAFGPHLSTTALTHRAASAGTDHHHQRCPLAQVVDLDQINVAQAHQTSSHMRAGSTSIGVLPTRMSLSNSRLSRIPIHFWWIPTTPSQSRLPTHIRRASYFVIK